MADILDDPYLQPLADVVRSGLASQELKPEFNYDSIKEDLAAEIVYAIAGFPDWYFDTEDLRNGWVPKNPGDNKDSPLYGPVKTLVTETLDELRSPDALEPLPSEPDVDILINSLIGIYNNWPSWYYDYKMQKDKLAWALGYGENEEIYNSDDPYGGTDEEYLDGSSDSMGVNNVYDDDENEPWITGQDSWETDLYADEFEGEESG